MKDGDLSIAKRSFPELDPLFLLIRTTQHRPWVAALYVLDAETSTTSSEPALEFPFDEYLLRNGYLTALVEEPAPAGRSGTAESGTVEPGTAEQDQLDRRGCALRDSAGSGCGRIQNVPASGPG